MRKKVEGFGWIANQAIEGVGNDKRSAEDETPEPRGASRAGVRMESKRVEYQEAGKGLELNKIRREEKTRRIHTYKESKHVLAGTALRRTVDAAHVAQVRKSRAQAKDAVEGMTGLPSPLPLIPGLPRA